MPTEESAGTPSAEQVNSVRDAARRFLAAAVTALKDDDVLPTPRFFPHIRVGRDYFGDSAMSLAEFAELYQLLADSYGRFRSERAVTDYESPNGFIFGLLEMFVRSTGGEAGGPDAHPAEADEAVDAFVTALAANLAEVAACCVVSHLTTRDGAGRPVRRDSAATHRIGRRVHP